MAILTFIGICCMMGGDVRLQPEVLKRTVEEFIRQSYSDSPEEVVVEFRNLPAVPIVLSDTPSLRVVPGARLFPRGALTLPVEIIVGGKVVHRLAVSVNVRTYGEVLVATAQIAKHALLLESDFRRQRVETTHAPADRLAHDDDLTGMRAARIIAAGSILCRSMLEPKPAILRDQLINLEVRSGSVFIAAPAIAREDGYAGNMVEVQRVHSRERLKARVVNGTTARIEFQGQPNRGQP